jgi:chemotaxis protein MotB
MAAGGKQLQPIIIKRVKKGGHGAHGGAWKIAYADFVTAMMAFFLLMWLLGSTTEGDRKGISDYFNAPVMVALFGGAGAGSSSSIIDGGGQDITETIGEVRRGDTDFDSSDAVSRLAKQEQARLDRARLEGLREKMENLITVNPRLNEFKDQIRIDIVADGLHIQILDEQNRPMFDSGSAVVRPEMRNILREIGVALADVENRVALAGHTDATPYGSGQRGYSNWELSADRANASRRELVAAGLPEEKLTRVLGLASSHPLVPEAPTDPVNRRISIIVMTQEAEERLGQPFQSEGGAAAGGVPRGPAAPGSPGPSSAPGTSLEPTTVPPISVAPTQGQIVLPGPVRIQLPPPPPLQPTPR